MAKAWLLRPYPHNHDICRLDYFRENNLIAIGWPGINSLAGKSRDQIKEILEGHPYNLQSLQFAIGDLSDSVGDFREIFRTSSSDGNVGTILGELDGNRSTDA